MEIEQLEKKYNFKLTDVWTEEADFYIYAESTADGYEIFVATQTPVSLNICEDVHYYDSDLSDVLLDLIVSNEEQSLLIYVEDVDALYVQDTMEELKNYDDN